MNQQRSRRFRSAQEARENDEKKEEFQKLLAKQNAAKGIDPDQDIKEQVIKKTWDRLVSSAVYGDQSGTDLFYLV